MSSFKEVKKIMQINENFHMCDVSVVSEKGVHLESWDVVVPKSDFEQIADLIYKDGYDVGGFQLLEIPHPQVFCFGHLENKQYFDVVKFWGDRWQFSYCEDSSNKLASSIAEAIIKYELIE